MSSAFLIIFSCHSQAESQLLSLHDLNSSLHSSLLKFVFQLFIHLFIHSFIHSFMFVQVSAEARALESTADTINRHKVGEQVAELTQVTIDLDLDLDL